MFFRRRSALVFLLALPLAASYAPAAALELSGSKTITLHSRDGQTVPIGQLKFQPQGGGARFVIELDHLRLKDYFLSMKEFKCLESAAEVLCHVPYPYANPRTVAAGDLGWLEHGLMFFFKTPQDFGAKLWNGVYFQLRETPTGLIGTPQAIDLNMIGAPPADLSVPPYGPAERSEIDPGARWFNRLSIE
jgi:hypothetical protein